MNVLLIEPDYRNKYPPLGLMKISTFHKRRNDNVVFYKGKLKELRYQLWDRIYISTLFTFQYKKTIDTVKFYLGSVANTKNVFIGGVLATLMKDTIQEELDVSVIAGLLNTPGKLGIRHDETIDCMTPDYSIISQSENPLLSYQYQTLDSYFAYATRGCIRKCHFCAVPFLEGKFQNSFSIYDQVKAIEAQSGSKRHLLLMDNNVLAAEDHFFNIINDIKRLGFLKGATQESIVNGRKVRHKRIVDFNQGLDARLIVKNENYIKALSEIAINPLRIAFDNIKNKDTYVESTRLAARYGIPVMSNYLLFNNDDTPEELYTRLQINIYLNEEFYRKGWDSRIWSFPMRYSPVFGEFATTRKFIGEKWSRKQIRAIQNILSATHGVVGPRRSFFERAFGKDETEFISILQLPEKYIIDRNLHLNNGDVKNLAVLFSSLSEKETTSLKDIIASNQFKNNDNSAFSRTMNEILNIYSIRRR